MLDLISTEHCRLLVLTLGHSVWQVSLMAARCCFCLRVLPTR